MSCRPYFWVLAVLLIATVGGPATAASRSCPDPKKSEAKLRALNIGPAANPIIVDPKVIEDITTFVSSNDYADWCGDVFPRTNNVRLTGPFIGGRGITTHARVRVFYSEEVVAWLDNNREGAIPDGAMIVKEMHPLPEDIAMQNEGTPAGWAVMLRDSTASKDGWLWFLYYAPKNQTTGVTYTSAQYGLSFCVSCHASTDTNQQTFAFVGNLENRDVATYSATSPIFVDPSDPGLGNLLESSHGRMAAASKGDPSVLRQLLYKPVALPDADVDIALLRLLQEGVGAPILPVEAEQLLLLPPDAIADHVVQPPDNPLLFVTGDACVGCHDASSLLNTVDPNMTIPAVPKIPAPPPHLIPSQTEYGLLNVSPYGEWSSSMMHLSSRDPIFRAQFEYERTSLAGNPTAVKEVTQLCLSCHAAMGERQFPEIAENPMAFYAYPGAKHLPSGEAGVATTEYAALARDGVSCAVCHHVSADGLGEEETFNAGFKTGPADELYGPFDDVKTYPMEQALGVKPRHGSQIKDSALCGSCHSVRTPVYDEAQQLTGHADEQTTYMEWANSKFAKKRSKSFETCQDCHMPRNRPGSTEPLVAQIANIEDSTFPYVPNRSSSDDLQMIPRTDYARHTLTGINVFGLAMFQQFPGLLGANTFSPNRAFDVAPSQILTMRESVEQATQRTAEITIKKASICKDRLRVDLQVENLAGHKLPSGVGFRRAFLEVSARDSAGDVLWCSGCTDGVGAIIGAQGERLPSELTKTASESQPDYKLITQQNQVQIYEERHVDCSGELTTSFVRLCKTIKDNRILPDGWRSSGPYAEQTKPVAVEGKSRAGRDLVGYEIDLPEGSSATTVQVALNYQSIPPYYLVDRFSLLGTGDQAEGRFPETERLLYMTLHLDVDAPTTASKDWKLELAHAKAPIESCN